MNERIKKIHEIIQETKMNMNHFINEKDIKCGCGAIIVDIGETFGKRERAANIEEDSILIIEVRCWKCHLTLLFAATISNKDGIAAISLGMTKEDIEWTRAYNKEEMTHYVKMLHEKMKRVRPYRTKWEFICFS